MQEEFTEWYRTVALDATPETLTKRWAAVEALAAKGEKTRDNLTRAFLGLRGADFQVIRRDVVAADPTFPAGGADAELRLLAGATLDRLALANTKIALLVVGAAAKGLRGDVLVPRIVERAAEALVSVADKQRRGWKVDKRPLDRKQFDENLGKLSAARTANNQTDFNQHAETTANALSDMIIAAKTESDRLFDNVILLQEELDMLWWLMGGVSEIAKERIESLPLAATAVAAGVELANLVRQSPGPLSTETLISRSLRSKGHESTTLAQAVTAIPSELRNAIAKTGQQRSDLDLLPFHFACVKFKEVDGDEAWKTVVSKGAVNPNGAMSHVQLGLQLFQETLYARLP